jgi:hypothetical protein
LAFVTFPLYVAGAKAPWDHSLTKSLRVAASVKAHLDRINME